MEMKKYELIFILKPDKKEEELNSSIKKVEDLLLSLKAEKIEKNIWGKREIAYPILKYSYGFYVLMNFELNPSEINKINNALNIREDMIKYMVIKDEKSSFLEKARKKEEIRAIKRANRPKEELIKSPDEHIQLKKDYRREPYNKPRKEIHNPNLNIEGEAPSTILKKRNLNKTEKIEKEKGE